MDVLFLSISSNVGITCPGGSSEALVTCSVAYEVIVTVGKNRGQSPLMNSLALLMWF